MRIAIIQLFTEYIIAGSDISENVEIFGSLGSLFLSLSHCIYKYPTIYLSLWVFGILRRMHTVLDGSSLWNTEKNKRK